MLINHTHERLVALGLAGMAKALDDQQRQPDVTALTFEQRLGLMTLACRQCGSRGSGRGLGLVEPTERMIDTRSRQSRVPAHEWPARSGGEDVERIDLVAGLGRSAESEHGVDAPDASLKLGVVGGGGDRGIQHPLAQLELLDGLPEPGDRQQPGVEGGGERTRVVDAVGQDLRSVRLVHGLIEPAAEVEGDRQLGVDPRPLPAIGLIGRS